MRVVVTGILLALLACGSPVVKTAGESCVSSAECGEGLLCNLSTHECAENGAEVTVDAGVDAFMHPLIDSSGGSAKKPDAAIDAAVDAAPDAPTM